MGLSEPVQRAVAPAIEMIEKLISRPSAGKKCGALGGDKKLKPIRRRKNEMIEENL